MTSTLRGMIHHYIGGGWGKDEVDASHVQEAYVIRGTDFERVVQSDTSAVPLRYHKASNAASRILEDGDIVFEVSGGSKDQPVGRSLLITKERLGSFSVPAIPASFCKRIRPDSTKVDPRFLQAHLQLAWNDRRIVQWQVQSTGISNFHFEDFLDQFELDLPPLSAQRRIADILSSYDELIESNRRRIKILEAMSRALYREWFVHFRFPGHEHHRGVASPLGEIPEGWEVKRLAELCSRIESGGTPRRNVDEYWERGEIDWYKTGELRDGFLFDSQEKISARGQRESTARLFEPGTILMAIYGSPTVGRMGILTRHASCNQAALGLVANKALISQSYLFFVLLSLRDHFNGLAQGAAQQNISKEKVADTLAVVPPSNIIVAFGNNVEPIFALIQNLQRQVGVLHSTRDLLLPRLLSGEVHVEGA